MGRLGGVMSRLEAVFGPLGGVLARPDSVACGALGSGQPKNGLRRSNRQNVTARGGSILPMHWGFRLDQLYLSIYLSIDLLNTHRRPNLCRVYSVCAWKIYV